jgi:hypothetical protein
MQLCHFWFHVTIPNSENSFETIVSLFSSNYDAICNFWTIFLLLSGHSRKDQNSVWDFSTDRKCNSANPLSRLDLHRREHSYFKNNNWTYDCKSNALLLRVSWRLLVKPKQNERPKMKYRIICKKSLRNCFMMFLSELFSIEFSWKLRKLHKCYCLAMNPTGG